MKFVPASKTLLTIPAPFVNQLEHLGLAGLKKYVGFGPGAKGQTLLAVECGANINFDRLRYISERTEIGEKREAILAVTIPEEPGSFKAFCAVFEQAQYHRI